MENKKELGIYIHIPFCERKCDYCDFLSAPADRGTKAAYVEALLKEIRSCGEWAKEYLVSTVFIGGGTPTSLDEDEIPRIMEALKEVFRIPDSSLKAAVPALEATVEMNPGTVDRQKLLKLKEAGINRISMGLQSADNGDLKLLGRIHTFQSFLENYRLARELGFHNINVDLMSSLPGQTLEGWMDVLQKAVSLKPEHISAYSLIIEEGTPFYERYARVPVNEELERTMYWQTAEYLKAQGYGHYEISNYALEGRECRHNISYWIRKNYLGIGLGASSMIDNVRFHNEEVLEKYMLEAGTWGSLQRERQEIGRSQQMEEFMFLGLRLKKGINREEFYSLFGERIEEVYGDVLKRSEKDGLLTGKDGRIYLTDRGIDLSNTVMARFLFS